MDTIVRWILGTRPNGKYLPAGETDQLTSNREEAKPFLTEKSAKEALAGSRAMAEVVKESLDNC